MQSKADTPTSRIHAPAGERQQPWGGYLIGLLIGGLLSLPAVMARSELDAETQALLVEAVEAAADLDAYYSRCRGEVSGRRTENLNKLIVGKLRTTVLTVQDDFFPERGYRRAQARLESDFLARLQAAGGCQGAKDSKLPEELRQRYETALEAIRRLP
ncbi:hypothetical protein [Thermochromatium tepidum]|uniref:Uncharacterized protein n=1 Tax=Thermochromatium tepidum ATCC 43061 TaxID=316276 RepID=A0A6I6E8E6_THETI|nr:hypothetical protein [Thermochromatium tepidum]QGU31596.1 hypothetical protein E6P07_00465 [Thermochromatium tepidum ATCC 43061]